MRPGEYVLAPQQLGHRVTAVKPLDGLWLELEFNGGERRRIDMRRFVRPGNAFEGIGKDPGLFRQVRIRGRTIEWPDGATLDPDVLYQESKAVT